MKQTKKGSMIEALANIAIGYCVALAGQMIIFPVVGLSVTLEKNIYIGLFFTALSIARSYTVRRVFNNYGWFTK